MKRVIAIVDDDSSFRKLLGKAVDAAGNEFSVLEFADGEPVCVAAKAGTLHADLILLDLNMPRVSGFEVLRQLRALPNYRDTLIVVMTVSTANIDREKSLLLGATSFLSKPLGFSELQESISGILTSLLTESKTRVGT